MDMLVFYIFATPVPDYSKIIESQAKIASPDPYKGKK